MQCPVCVEAQWAFSCTESLSFDTVDIRPLCLVRVRACKQPSQSQEDSTEVGAAAYHERGAAGIVQEDGGVVSCLQGKACVSRGPGQPTVLIMGHCPHCDLLCPTWEKGQT